MVSIEIDLDIAKAQDEIAALKTELRTLEEEGIDIGNLDLDDLVDGLDDVSVKMEEIRRQARGIGDDIEDSLDGFDGIDLNLRPDVPDGGTGAVGGEADPPVADGGADGMSNQAFLRKMDSLFGSREGLFRADGDDLLGVGALTDLKQHPKGGFTTSRSRIGMDEVDPLRDPRRIGDRDGFGIEPVSMTGRGGHRESELNTQELRDVSSVDIGWDSSRPIGMDMPDADVELPDIDNWGDLNEVAGDLHPRIQKSNRSANRLGRTLKSMKPTMRKWWSLLALIIPLLITFAVQALGVAAALGSVAIAGAAVIGLGLVGHGDSMADAWSNAQSRIQEVKEELFEVFQPTMREFAPISDRFLDFAPDQLQSLAETMEGLTAYEGTIFGGFAGTVDVIDRLIAKMVESEQVISHLAMRFGAILGDSILDLFSFLVEEASENEEMLINLGVAFTRLGSIVYELSKTFTGLVIIFSPLLKFLNGVAKTINGTMIGSILEWVAALGLVGAALTSVLWSMVKVRVALMVLSTVGSSAIIGFASTAITWLFGVDSAIWTTIASLTTLRNALIATGVGALLVGGGVLLGEAMNLGYEKPQRSGTGRDEGSTVVNNNYEINQQGEMNNSNRQRILDVIKQNDQEQQARLPGSGASG